MRGEFPFFDFVTALLPILAIIGVGYLLSRRRARQVLEDLRENGSSSSNPLTQRRASGMWRTFAPLIYPLLGGALGVITAISLGAWFPAPVILGVSGASLGYLIRRSHGVGRERSVTKEIDYSLPLVMERLVMAVESGLDVIPAIGAVVTLEGEESRDPVIVLMRKVRSRADAGASFEDALREVALSSESSSLRHAFVHLGVAYREGGELTLPLRELSDATQVHYQESVEEEIAKMPVKATAPLVLTFAGLMIMFITAPVLQIVSFTGRAVSIEEIRR